MAKLILTIVSLFAVSTSYGADQEIEERVEILNHIPNVGTFLSVVKGQFGEGPAAGVQTLLADHRVSKKHPLARLKYSNKSFFAGKKRIPFKIVDSKQMKFSYQGRDWQYDSSRPFDNNFKQLLSAISPVKKRNGKYPKSTALGAVTFIVAAISATQGSTPESKLPGVAASWLIVGAAYWAGENIVEYFSSGMLISSCQNHLLKFGLKGSEPMQTYTPAEFLRTNANFTASEKQAINRHLDRYYCDENWANNLGKSFENLTPKKS